MTHDEQLDSAATSGGANEGTGGVSKLMAAAPGLAAPEQPGVRAMIRAAVFPEITTPAKIGRFLILRMLGAGGVGVVFLAYDEVLDRRVAVKLLRAETPERWGGSARLQREAKIMARLNHPNVVAVHDFGEHEGRFFVAMEYIEGRTLGQWLTAAPRGWREIREHFLQAGRGLVAAHAAGIIHRDFKPGNVLVGDDGRVRVADFGLARDDTREPPRAREPTTLGGPRGPAEVCTITGQVLGTPAYMSLEQCRGEVADARSDVFSFCVALFEALYGVRPFAGATIAALDLAIADQALVPRPAERRIPGWLDAAVTRGLAAAPGRRWPSMQALLEELARAPIRRRWYPAAAVALAVLAVAGTVVATRPRPVIDPCATAEERLVGVWDNTRETALGTALMHSDVIFAAETWKRVRPVLDAYAGAWTRAYRDRCEAHGRREESDTFHDQAMRCLAESRTALGAAGEALEGGGVETLERAVSLVAALPPVERCADLESLAASFRVPTDPAHAAEVERLRERLTALKVELEAAHYQRVGAELDGLASAVERTGSPPLARLFWALRAQEAIDGHEEDGLSAYLRALAAAITAGEEHEAIELAALIAGSAATLPRPDRTLVEVHSALARSFAARGPEDPGLEVRLDVALADLQRQEGALGESWRTALRAVERARGLGDADWEAHHMALVSLGSITSEMGRGDESAAAMREVIAIQDRHLGPQHPAQIWSLRILAWNQSSSDPEAAIATLDRVDALARALYGEMNAHRVEILQTRGVARENLGDLEGALAIVREAATLARRRAPLEMKLVIPAENSVGVLLDRVGRHDEARDHLVRIVEEAKRELGPDDINVAHVGLSLGDALLHGGDPGAAREVFAATAAVWSALDPDGPLAVYAENGLGLADVEQGRWAPARARLQRVLALREAGNAGPAELAATRFGIARTLRAVGERAHARELAVQALEGLRSLGPGHAREASAIDAWIAAQRGD